jgi:hypothetical protein
MRRRRAAACSLRLVGLVLADGSMAVLVTGCVLASVGAMGSEPVLGIVVCIISTLANAAWTVSSAVLLQQGAKPLDAVSLIFVSGPTCIATLLLFFLIPLPAFHQSDGTYYVAASELNRLGGDHRSGHAALPAGQVRRRLTRGLRALPPWAVRLAHVRCKNASRRSSCHGRLCSTWASLR